MKAIQGIMLLTIMLAVSCSNEPGKDETVPEIPPTAEENFVNAINEKFVWNSDGTELTARTNDDGSGMLGYEYNFHSLVEGSATQAIYEVTYGDAFIGVELFSDNTEAVMYKKDTVEEWTIITDVSFTPEHKLISSAKGEWIASAKSKTIIIDSIEYTMKNDGHLYLANVLTFTHVSTTQPVTRTPNDGFLRDRAIYKKSDAEFFGLLVDNTLEELTIYKESGVNYWGDEASVVFDDANKVDPLADFKGLIAGTYNGIYDINITTSELELVDLVINADGTISKDGTTLYTLVSSKPDNTAIFSLQVDVPDSGYRALVDKFIGFSFIEVGKMTLHRQGMKTVYDTADAVVIDDTTRIEPVNIFKYSLPKGDIPVGAEVLTVKADGSLYEGETVKYTFLELHVGVYTGIQTTNAIYTDTTGKFLGIQLDIVEQKIYLYLDGTTSPWVNKTDVEFIPANKVIASDTWDSVGTGLVPTTIHWPSAVIDNDGNVVLAYQDDGKLSVQLFNKTLGSWSSVADKLNGETVAGPSIAKDSHGNLYVSYEGSALAVVKWTKALGTWANMGTGDNLMVDGANGQKSSITVDKDDNIYVLHPKAGGATAGSSVRKYNSIAKTWDLVGPAEAIKGSGSKQILTTSTGELWVVSSAGSNAGNKKGQLVVQRYNIINNTWDTVGGAEDTGNIDNAYTVTMGIDHLDNVYVAYEKTTSGRKATILKLNAAKDGWDTIGDGIGTDANHLRISFYSDGTPIIATSGDPANQGLKVMKYENETWSKIGKDPQVSAGNAYYSGLVVNTDSNTIYAAYSDRTISGNGLSVRQHVRILP